MTKTAHFNASVFSAATLTLANSSGDLKPTGPLEDLIKSTTTKVHKNKPEEFVFTPTKEYLDVNVKPYETLGFLRETWYVKQHQTMHK